MALRKGRDVLNILVAGGAALGGQAVAYDLSRSKDVKRTICVDPW